MYEFSSSKWIWENDNREIDQYVYFRKELSFQKEIESITIHISASNKYKLFVNNEMRGFGPSPCTPKYQYYDTYTVKSVCKNDVAFAITAYCIGEQTFMVTEQNKGLPAFIFEAVINFKDKSVEKIVSDENWKTIMAPYIHGNGEQGAARISNWGGYEEVYLSMNEPVGWKQLLFNENGWNKAIEVSGARKKFACLIAREIPFLKTEIIHPKEIVQTECYKGKISHVEGILNRSGICEIDASKAGSFPSIVLDFGKEVVGYPHIEVCGSNGANMSLWYGESLDMMRVDTLIMNGEKQEYIPFHRRAFRYIKISFNNSTEIINLYNVTIENVRYPYQETGNFHCSNDLLNRIYETSIYTVKLGSQEHYEDSIMREAAQWLADARVMALVGYWAFGEKQLPQKAIRQFFRTQMDNGKICSTGPQETSMTYIDFCQHFVFMLYEYYFHTGETELLEEYYNPLLKLMEMFERIECEDGLISMNKDKGWVAFIDWANLDKRDKSTALNCFYYKMLQDFAGITSLLNRDGADRYYKKAEKLKETINQKIFTHSNGLFTDCIADEKMSEKYSQQTNLLAVYCGIVSKDKFRGLIEKVYSTEGVETIKGVFLLSFLLDTLFQYGLPLKAMEIMESFWGEMLNRDATTWWETFDPATPSSCIPYVFTQNAAVPYMQFIPVSHCHGWGAGPAVLLVKNILGIKPLKPGFEEIEFSPYTENLDYAQGSIPTPYGTIKVQWQKESDGKIKYSIEKPDIIQVIDKII